MLVILLGAQHALHLLEIAETVIVAETGVAEETTTAIPTGTPTIVVGVKIWSGVLIVVGKEDGHGIVNVEPGIAHGAHLHLEGNSRFDGSF